MIGSHWVAFCSSSMKFPSVSMHEDLKIYVWPTGENKNLTLIIHRH